LSITLVGAAAIAVVLAAVGCGGGSPRAVSAPPRPPAHRPTRQASLPDVVQRVRSGVVRIETTFCSGGEVGQGVGTGFVVGPRLVATVDHVVDHASAIVVKQNGKQLSTATVIGKDTTRDLALLRLAKPVRGYEFKLAEKAPRLGDEVAALGFPLGLPLTLTKGTISGLDRTIPIEHVKRERLVQTDAAINPGNSGGPLLRTDTGEVIGLVDLGGNGAIHGIAFAVSSQVAAPLVKAWRVAPQPIGLSPCPVPAPPPTVPPPAAPAPPPPPDPVPTVYEGRFTAVDRLERCNATADYVYCSAGPSGRAVKLTVGADVVDLGVRGSQDLGGPSMPEGTSFTTPNDTISCDSSSRGISCRDLTNGASFVIGDYQVIVTHPGSEYGGGTPASYQGFFTAVDRLERCYATDSSVVCTAGPSGKGVLLAAGGDATYEGVTGSADEGGPSMPEGTSFTTPQGTFTCSSSSRGITCTDNATENSFTIGDTRVHVINNGHEVTY
jgi:hypothetical protein